MADSRLVVVCETPRQFDRVCALLAPAMPGLVLGVTEVDDLADVLEDTQIGLVMTMLGGEADHRTVSRVLWHCSRARRAVPVVAIADRYREDEALVCFQMGVTDYLGLAEHHDWVADVVARVVPPSGGDESAGPSDTVFDVRFGQEALASPIRA